LLMMPLVAVVRGTPGEEFEVVATAENGKQAVDAVLRLDADVLVIDIAMPVLDGLQAAKQLHKLNCQVCIVILTMHEDQEFVTAAFAVGACAYVIKSRLATDLVRAIREAMLGHIFVSPTLKMQEQLPSSSLTW
jgi:DNA-binding NarL/FixJ family response regulator